MDAYKSHWFVQGMRFKMIPSGMFETMSVINFLVVALLIFPQTLLNPSSSLAQDSMMRTQSYPGFLLLSLTYSLHHLLPAPCKPCGFCGR